MIFQWMRIYSWIDSVSFYSGIYRICARQQRLTMKKLVSDKKLELSWPISFVQLRIKLSQYITYNFVHDKMLYSHRQSTGGSQRTGPDRVLKKKVSKSHNRTSHFKCLFILAIYRLDTSWNTCAFRSKLNQQKRHHDNEFPKKFVKHFSRNRFCDEQCTQRYRRRLAVDIFGFSAFIANAD